MPQPLTRKAPLNILDLPAEIRSNIWSRLVGRNTIHLEAGEKMLCDHEICYNTACPSKFQWICYVCTSPGTRLQHQRWFRSSDHLVPRSDNRRWEKTFELDSHGYFQCDQVMAHGTCGLINGIHKFGEDVLSTELRYNICSLLHLCRLVSAEATRVIYNTSTFAFHNEYDFFRWLEERTKLQRRSIGGFEITVGYIPLTLTHIYGNPLWERIFSSDAVQDLSQLNRLHIYLAEDDMFIRQEMSDDENFQPEAFIEGDSDVMQRVLDIDRLLGCFGRLRTSPLREVTAIVACSQLYVEYQRALLTQAQRVTMADHFIEAVQGREIAALSSTFPPQTHEEDEERQDNNEVDEDWDDSSEESESNSNDDDDNDNGDNYDDTDSDEEDGSRLVRISFEKWLEQNESVS